RTPGGPVERPEPAVGSHPKSPQPERKMADRTTLSRAESPYFATVDRPQSAVQRPGPDHTVGPARHRQRLGRPMSTFAPASPPDVQTLAREHRAHVVAAVVPIRRQAVARDRARLEVELEPGFLGRHDPPSVVDGERLDPASARAGRVGKLREPAIE